MRESSPQPWDRGQPKKGKSAGKKKESCMGLSLVVVGAFSFACGW